MQSIQASQHTLIQRGDATMKKTKEKVIPNIVKTYINGGVTVHIADNFIARTDEEKEYVDNRIRQSLMVIYQSEARRLAAGEQQAINEVD